MSVSLSQNTNQSYSNNSSELDQVLKHQFINGLTNQNNVSSMGRPKETERNQKIDHFFGQIRNESKKVKHTTHPWLKYLSNRHAIHFITCLLISMIIIVLLFYLRPFFIYVRYERSKIESPTHMIEPYEQSLDQESEKYISKKRMLALFSLFFLILYGIPSAYYLKKRMTTKKK